MILSKKKEFKIFDTISCIMLRKHISASNENQKGTWSTMKEAMLDDLLQIRTFHLSGPIASFAYYCAAG